MAQQRLPVVRGWWLCAQLVLFLACGCSATRAVRPVGPGRLSLSASVGGPLITNLGPPLPLTIPMVSARLGLTERTDVDFGVLLPIVRLVGIDMGIAHLALTQARLRPAVMVSGRAALAGPLGRQASWNLAWLEAQTTASWQLHRSVLTYVGAVGLWAPVTTKVLPSVLFGVSYSLPKGGLYLAAEARWLALNEANGNLSVKYMAPSGRGATGVVLALGYTFNLRRGQHAKP